MIVRKYEDFFNSSKSVYSFMTCISIVKEYSVITQGQRLVYLKFLKIISLYMIEDFTIHVYMLKILVRLLIEFVNLKEYYS